jgi:hypothetical protein
LPPDAFGAPLGIVNVLSTWSYYLSLAVLKWVTFLWFILVLSFVKMMYFLFYVLLLHFIYFCPYIVHLYLGIMLTTMFPFLTCSLC